MPSIPNYCPYIGARGINQGRPDFWGQSFEVRPCWRVVGSYTLVVVQTLLVFFIRNTRQVLVSDFFRLRKCSFKLRIGHVKKDRGIIS